MFKINTNFEGANCKIINIFPDKAIIDVELRDTVEDWFYWCFKVENANGKTITFEFPNVNRVGYFGPAISHDFKTWTWQFKDAHHNGNSFIYSFSKNEKEVYFAHDILYRPQHFFDFAKKHKIELKTFCITEKGRELKYFDSLKGDECIFLTARHHACESTGNYVLEGVMQQLLSSFKDKYRIICIPFVDYDGVIDGDQGKNRLGHDHNRDYDLSEPAQYISVAQIRELVSNLKVKYAFDFHSPWHLSNEHDKLSFVLNVKTQDNMKVFSELFEQENNAFSLPYFSKDNILPNTSWNKEESKTFIKFINYFGTELSCSIETPYFLNTDTTFSPEKAIETGKNFAKALIKYDNLNHY